MSISSGKEQCCVYCFMLRKNFLDHFFYGVFIGQVYRMSFNVFWHCAWFVIRRCCSYNFISLRQEFVNGSLSKISGGTCYQYSLHNWQVLIPYAAMCAVIKQYITTLG